MDEVTANRVLGRPQFTVQPLNGAYYRTLSLSTPEDHRAYQWSQKTHTDMAASLRQISNRDPTMGGKDGTSLLREPQGEPFETFDICEEEIEQDCRDSTHRLQEPSHCVGIGFLMTPSRPSSSRYTHFLSLPVGTTNSEFVTRVESFRAMALGTGGSGYPGITSSMFQKAERFHITLCMLTLPSDEAVKSCIQLLDTLQPAMYDALNTRCLRLAFNSGITTWEPSKKKNSSQHVVVFTTPSGPPEALSRLNALCQLIFKELARHGILSQIEQRRQQPSITLSKSLNSSVDNPQTLSPVTYHVTLLNSKYDWHQNSPTHLQTQSLIGDFQEKDFGFVHFRELHLSCLQPNRESSSGLQDIFPDYYPCAARYVLP